MLIIPVFGFIGDIKGMQFCISWSSLHNLTLQAMTTIILLITGLLSLVGYYIYLAYLDNIIGYYLVGMVAMPLFYAVIYWLYLKESSSGGKWHVHHWWIGFYFSLLSRFDTVISNIAFMCFYGVFLQGALTYGVTPIITCSI
jgi:hypothetical protein